MSTVYHRARSCSAGRNTSLRDNFDFFLIPLPSTTLEQIANESLGHELTGHHLTTNVSILQNVCIYLKSSIHPLDPLGGVSYIYFLC